MTKTISKRSGKINSGSGMGSRAVVTTTLSSKLPNVPLFRAVNVRVVEVSNAVNSVAKSFQLNRMLLDKTCEKSPALTSNCSLRLLRRAE